MPAAEGSFKYEKNHQRAYLGGRITGYQISHLGWSKDDTLAGLKTDRPFVGDEFVRGWRKAPLEELEVEEDVEGEAVAEAQVVQPVVAKD